MVFLASTEFHSDAALDFLPGCDFSIGVFYNVGAGRRALEDFVFDGGADSVTGFAEFGGGEFEDGPLELGKEYLGEAFLESLADGFEKSFSILGGFSVGGEFCDGSLLIDGPFSDEEVASAAGQEKCCERDGEEVERGFRHGDRVVLWGWRCQFR